MDSLRYWVHRVPRRRLPLRPRLRAGARALRRRPALGVLRRHPPGPGALAGQADRRAVGRRPRRLPGGQLPGAVDRVERHLPRHDARLLARRTPAPRRSPTRFTGSSDLYEDDGRRPVRVDQLHHRPRRLHAAPTSSPTTRSTTRPTTRTTATAPTTTARGTAASRARPTTPRCYALRRRQQRNFLTTLLLSQGVPMLLGGDEMGRTQGGNNNAWCQDNEISWFDWELAGRADRAARRSPSGLIALRREHPVFRRSHFLRGEQVEGSGLPDAWWFRPDGTRMTARRLGARATHVVGLFLNGEAIPTRDAARRADHRRLVPAAGQRPPRGRRRSRCRRAASATAGRSSCDTADPRRRRAAHAARERGAA